MAYENDEFEKDDMVNVDISNMPKRKVIQKVEQRIKLDDTPINNNHN